MLPSPVSPETQTCLRFQRLQVVWADAILPHKEDAKDQLARVEGMACVGPPLM